MPINSKEFVSASEETFAIVELGCSLIHLLKVYQGNVI